MTDPVVLEATLRRYTKNLMGTEKYHGHVDFITTQVLERVSGWKCVKKTADDPVYHADGYLYRIHLAFKADSALKASPVLVLSVALNDARLSRVKFNTNPYHWKEAPSDNEINAVRNMNRPDPDALMPDDASSLVLKKIPILEDLDPSLILQPFQIKIPSKLLSGRDVDIESDPSFRGIHGRSPHIRRVLHSINSYCQSSQLAMDRKKDDPDCDIDLTRSHVLLWGPPAGAKTRIVRGIKRLLPKGGYFTLDAPAATKAGIVRLFTQNFRDRCPAVVFVEEIEKMREGLEGWLGLLDERAEVQKFTHHRQDKVPVDFLCIATCNDKKYLDTLMRGALGSRFAHQIYVPRPNAEEMRLILMDRVRDINGDMEWVDVCIDLMNEFRINDPRAVKSWLDYGKALTSKKALADLRLMFNRQKMDTEKTEEVEEESDQDIAFREMNRARLAEMSLPLNGRRHGTR